MAPPNITSGNMLDLSVDQVSDFSGKVALVTGGSSGVGLEFVRILAAKNIKGVVVADINPLPEADAKMLGLRGTFVKTDVTNWESIQAAFSTALQIYGFLDLVYANAGVGELEHLFVTEEIPGSKLLRPPNYKCLEINTIGVLNTVKLAVHTFRKIGNVAPNTKEPGRIVMTASIAGYETPGLPIYTASKHALIGLLRSAAMDLHESFGIPLNAVAPGPMIGTNIVHSFAPRNTKSGGQPGVVNGDYVIPNQTPYAAAVAAAVLFQQPYEVYKCSVVSYDGKYKEVEGFYRNNSPLRAGEGNELGVPPDGDDDWRRLYDCTFDAA